ncbi:MAG: hypothetical protein RID53_02205 [Coleofasciculus sp. B1-GNL1-01]
MSSYQLSGAGETEEDEADGEYRGAEGDCVGAGFTTIFLVTPKCN